LRNHLVNASEEMGSAVDASKLPEGVKTKRGSWMETNAQESEIEGEGALGFSPRVGGKKLIDGRLNNRALLERTRHGVPGKKKRKNYIQKTRPAFQICKRWPGIQKKRGGEVWKNRPRESPGIGTKERWSGRVLPVRKKKKGKIRPGNRAA